MGLKDPDYGRCPRCQQTKTQRLVSKFRIGGQGDLRESTQHGCHDYTGLDSGHGQDHAGDHAHDHDHDHDHTGGDDHGHPGPEEKGHPDED